jgi:hypothetical protein
MHPDMNELLALRDGEAAPAVADHVQRCRECGDRLAAVDRLAESLRDLPELDPPPGAWQRVVTEHQQRQRFRWVKRSVAVAAAAAVVAAAVVVLELGKTRSPESQPMTATVAESIDPLDQLMAASMTLETVLQAAPLQSPVMRPAEAARIVALEDSIAVIDLQLASSTDLSRDYRVALWGGRVELLDQLVQVRGRAGTVGGVRHALNRDEGSGP